MQECARRSGDTDGPFLKRFKSRQGRVHQILQFSVSSKAASWRAVRCCRVYSETAAAIALSRHPFSLPELFGAEGRPALHGKPYDGLADVSPNEWTT